MERLIKAGQLFYGVAIAAIGVQQFFYGDFRPVIVPAWPVRIPWLPFWAWLTGAALIGGGIAIIFEKKGRPVSLFLGGLFLILFCFCHVPYEIIVDPYKRHPGVWTNALKELALSGGAFVIAGSFTEEKADVQKKYSLKRGMGMIISIGSIFFALMLIIFGIDHFLYAQYVSALVPNSFPDHIFWTYFAGVALMGSGVAIILKIRVRAIGSLLAGMLFLWVVLLHIPRAIADPFMEKGNEITSVFEALGFGGIALVIAYSDYGKNDRIDC